MAKPLEHKTIVLTRRPEQSASMTDALTALGARVVSFPTIEIISPPNKSVIKQAVLELDSYEWIIFTSVNAVDCFFGYFGYEAGQSIVNTRRVACGYSARRSESDASTTFSHSASVLDPLFRAKVSKVALRSAPSTHYTLSSLCSKIAVVGPATAEALEAYGVKVDLMAESFQAEGLVEAFAALPDDFAKEGKVLIPRALEARDVLTEELPKLGYEVIIAPVYQTVRATPPVDAFADLDCADGIVFTSPSTARNFVEIFNSHSNNSALNYLKNRKVFSIGPITSDELRTLGLSQEEIIEAAQSTSTGLVKAIASSL